MDDITYKMMPLPAVLLMEVDFPKAMVNTLNKYLDNLLKKKDRKTAADTLVGQIHGGEQLSMDHTCEELDEVNVALCSIAAKYVSDFLGFTGQTMAGNRQVEIDHLWSVHSYAGDYNPIHDHGTKTAMGVSCTTWTKVPEQISKLPDPSIEGKLSYFNASGCSDGFLEFIYGRNSTRDKEILKPTYATIFKPKVGKIYFFPSWLQHTVYPFRGEGERRTVAANFNCFPVENNE
jgi:hypothetical protein|tara:strand:- start:16456 stop:17154 length:699 start_codon:yes stop_codon:yes gene_type:complete